MSGFYTGIAGALNGHLITSIHPEGYTFTQSILFLTFIVVGGMASIPGSIMGAVFLTVVQQILSFGFPGLESRFKDLPAIMYGLFLIVCIMFLPGGLSRLAFRGRERLAQFVTGVDPRPRVQDESRDGTPIGSREPALAEASA